MQESFTDSTLAIILLGIIAITLLVQVYLLMRIRNILQALAINLDSSLHFWRKNISAPRQAATAPATPPICQFCKHRLAYINTGESDEGQEEFYHRCGLRNIAVRLNDSCNHFEADPSAMM